MKEVMIRDNGLAREATKRERAALSASGNSVTRDVTSAASTMTTAAVFPGSVIVRTAGGAVTDVFPTAAALTAANPDLGDGDVFMVRISNRHGTNTVTLSGGTATTLVSGSVNTILALTQALVMFQRTSATAWTYEIVG